MKHLILAALILVTTQVFSFSEDEKSPMPPMFGGGRMKLLQELKLSDTQKEKFEQLRFDMEKKEIELRAKLETSKLEMRKLIMSDVPDKAAIDKKIPEVVSNEAALRSNKLSAWFEGNKLLNADQQKIWVKFLRVSVFQEMNKNPHGMGGMRHRMPPMPEHDEK